MRIIPTQAVPWQRVAVQLGTQACLIWIYQQSTGLYVDLTSNGASIVNGIIGQNNNRIVRDLYLGFAGDLIFLDTQGTDDPDYVGLGSRFSLAWLTPEEVSLRVAQGEL